MDLLLFLQRYFPEQIFCHSEEMLYEIFESKDFRLMCNINNESLSIDYLRVTEKGDRYGDVVVASLALYCSKTNRSMYVCSPLQQYYKFWRRVGFTSAFQYDPKWKYQERKSSA